MTIRVVPSWMENLEEEDITFIKNFMLVSGSLKEMAAKYDVTYPTVRLRLDRLIDRIKMTDDQEAEPYVKLIKRLALEDRLDFETAKLLISEYKKERKYVIRFEFDWYEHIADSVTAMVVLQKKCISRAGAHRGCMGRFFIPDCLDI